MSTDRITAAAIAMYRAAGYEKPWDDAAAGTREKYLSRAGIAIRAADAAGDTAYEDGYRRGYEDGRESMEDDQ